MKKLILFAVVALNASSSFADASSFSCSFLPNAELAPHISYYQNGFRYSPGNLTDGPFELVAMLSDRFDDQAGDQVIFTSKNRNGGTTINDFPEYSGFNDFCPTNVCRLMIDRPVSTARRSGQAKAMIQKKTEDGNFTNYKAITCSYSFD